MGSQRVGHNWATELNGTETIPLKNASSSSCFAPQVILWGSLEFFSCCQSGPGHWQSLYSSQVTFPITSRCSVIKNFSYPNTLNRISHTHTLIDTTEHTYWHNWASASVLISSISLTEIHVHWCLLSPWPEPHLLLDTQTPFPVSGTWDLENHKLVRYSATYWMPWRDQPFGWFMARNCCAPCREDSLEKATHSSILAWRIPWTEEPGRL